MIIISTARSTTSTAVLVSGPVNNHMMMCTKLVYAYLLLHLHHRCHFLTKIYIVMVSYRNWSIIGQDCIKYKQHARHGKKMGQSYAKIEIGVIYWSTTDMQGTMVLYSADSGHNNYKDYSTWSLNSCWVENTGCNMPEQSTNQQVWLQNNTAFFPLVRISDFLHPLIHYGKLLIYKHSHKSFLWHIT